MKNYHNRNHSIKPFFLENNDFTQNKFLKKKDTGYIMSQFRKEEGVFVEK